jgi:hypothetical protein
MNLAYAPNRAFGFWGSDHGLGEGAAGLRSIIGEARGSSSSVVLEERLQDAFRELAEACQGSYLDSWNGYDGGVPAQSEACGYAMEFLQALPSTVPLPDITIEQDGEIGLDWLLAHRLALSISISGTGKLSYAAIFGPNRAHGIEQFADGLPRAIRDSIVRLLSEAKRRGVAPP